MQQHRQEYRRQTIPPKGLICGQTSPSPATTPRQAPQASPTATDASGVGAQVLLKSDSPQATKSNPDSSDILEAGRAPVAVQASSTWIWRCSGTGNGTFARCGGPSSSTAASGGSLGRLASTDSPVYRRRTGIPSLLSPGSSRSKSDTKEASATDDGNSSSDDFTARLEVLCARAQRVIERNADLLALADVSRRFTLRTSNSGCSAAVAAAAVAAEPAATGQTDPQLLLRELERKSRTAPVAKVPDAVEQSSVMKGNDDSAAYVLHLQPQGGQLASPPSRECSSARKTRVGEMGSALGSEDGAEHENSSSSMSEASSRFVVGSQSVGFNGVEAGGSGSGASDGGLATGLAEQLERERARADELEARLRSAEERHAKEIKVLQSVRVQEVLMQNGRLPLQSPPSPQRQQQAITGYGMESAAKAAIFTLAHQSSSGFWTPMGLFSPSSQQTPGSVTAPLALTPSAATAALQRSVNSPTNSRTCGGDGGDGGSTAAVAATEPGASMSLLSPLQPSQPPTPTWPTGAMPGWLEQHLKQHLQKQQQLEAQLEQKRQRERELMAQMEQQQFEYETEVVLRERRYRQDLRQQRSAASALEQKNWQLQSEVRKLRDRLDVRDEVIAVLTMDCETAAKKAG